MAVLAAVLGLVLSGAALGHLLWPKQEVQVVSVARSTPTAAPAPGGMPDVLGLEEAFARRALQDAGITATVTTTSRAAAGPVGQVIAQSPAPGAQADKVQLTLSARAVMGKYAGVPAAQVRTALEELGTVVSMQRVVAPGAPAGSVVKTTPGPGAQVPGNVTVEVADPGDPLGLTEVRSIDSEGCSTASSVRTGSLAASSAVTCRRSYGTDPLYVEYDLSRRVQAVRWTLGLDNSGLPGTATVIVRGDGKELSTQRVAFGQTVEVFVATPGVIRLRVDVAVSGEDTPTVVLADPVFLGDAAELAALK